MQLATVMLAIGGDSGNTIQKFEVTPSEVAVLRVIHGEDAVTDVQVIGDAERNSRTERERLAGIYGATKDDNQQSILTTLFPGIAARMFEKFDELGLPDDFYKAERTSRQQPVAAIEPVEQPVALYPDLEQPVGQVEIVEDDGIGEMNDGVADKADNVLG